jgi:uncharacterized delta-60 repeat protein
VSTASFDRFFGFDVVSLYRFKTLIPVGVDMKKFKELTRVAAVLDPSFGDRGKVDLAFHFSGRFTIIYLCDCLVLEDKSIVVVASVIKKDYGPEYPALIKITKDGRVDEEFGVAGVAFEEYGGDRYDKSIHIDSINLLEDGRILMVCDVKTVPEENGITVYRPLLTVYSAMGQLDKDFNPEKMPVPLPLPSMEDEYGPYPHLLGSAIQQADGAIVFSFHTCLWDRGGYRGRSYVVRVTTQGELDTSFNELGYVEVRGAGYGMKLGQLRLTRDEKIVVIGLLKGQGAIVRLNSSGTMDSSFGSEGFVPVSMIVGANAQLSDVLLTDGGNIRIVGSFIDESGNRTLLTGFDSSGQPDANFSEYLERGRFLRIFSAGGVDDRLWVGGAGYGVDGAFHGAIARMAADGTPDVSLGPTGQAVLLDSLYFGGMALSSTEGGAPANCIYADQVRSVVGQSHTVRRYLGS